MSNAGQIRIWILQFQDRSDIDNDILYVREIINRVTEKSTPIITDILWELYSKFWSLAENLEFLIIPYIIHSYFHRSITITIRDEQMRKRVFVKLRTRIRTRTNFEIACSPADNALSNYAMTFHESWQLTSAPKPWKKTNQIIYDQLMDQHFLYSGL